MLIVRRKGFLRNFLGTAIAAPKQLWRALRDMNNAQGTYINTIIAMDFLLMARFSRRPVVLHVHEIPLGKELAIFRALVMFANRPVIFNSEASKKAFSLPARFETHVVYNGFKDVGEPPRRGYESGKKLRILVIGRINRWKGQEVLVDACALLTPEVRQLVDVRIVGDVFEGLQELREALVDRINQAGLTDIIRVEPFEDDPRDSYLDADVVVVPSRLPEPFGRVAVEAMAYGCAVIASNHGGLTEIVVDGETGKLFTPGDSNELARYITEMVQSPADVARFARNGRARFVNTFTQDVIDRSFIDAIRPILASS